MPFAHSKTTYVRPLCETNGGRNVYRNITAPVQQYTVSESTTLRGMNKNPVDNFKHLDEMKTKELDKLNSLHSKLFAEVEEIQKWKTDAEMENRHEKKKVEDLQQTIESQRKVVLDLQLQNENLSYRLSEEIQQRSFAIEKLHSTKELLSALKKHYNILQGQFDYRNKIEEMILTSDSKRMQEIEILKNKYEKICIEHSERVGFLNDALAAETNKALTLKEEIEQQISVFENEKESIYTLYNDSQIGFQNLLNELEDEKNNASNLLQEKKELQSVVLQLETSNEGYLLKLKEEDENFKALQCNKLELEEKCLSENQKCVELQSKYEECLDKASFLSLEFEKSDSISKQTIQKLESNASEMEQRIEEEELKNEKLYKLLQDASNENCVLETAISDYRIKLETFEKVKNDLRDLDEKFSQLTAENMSMSDALKNVNCELLQSKYETENAQKLYDLKEEEYMKNTEEFQNNLIIKENQLKDSKEVYDELVAKFQRLEKELEMKSQLISDKEENILSLKSIMDQNEEALQSLNAEIVTLKEKLEKEQNSVKDCLECNTLQEKINDMEASVSKVKEDLRVQIFLTKDTIRMLKETEANYTNSCIMKEKELIASKNEIYRLQDDIHMKYFTKEEYEEIKSENVKLKEEFEAFKSEINTKEEYEELKSENAKLKEKFEAFKSEINTANKKQCTDNKEEIVKKAFENKKNEDKNTKSSFNGSEKMDAPTKANKIFLETSQKMNGKRQKQKSYDDSAHLKNKIQKTIPNSTDSENTSPPENIPLSLPNSMKQYEVDSSSSSEYFEFSYFNEKKEQPSKPAGNTNPPQKVTSMANLEQRRYQPLLSQNIASKRKYTPQVKKQESGNSIWSQPKKPLLVRPNDIFSEKNVQQKNVPIMASQRRFFKTPLVDRNKPKSTPAPPCKWF